MRHVAAALLAALLAVPATSSAATLHRCVSPDGSTSFSDNPCPALPRATKRGAFDLEMLIVSDQSEKDAYLQASPAARKGTGRLRTLKLGPKYLFPIVVENYRPDPGQKIYFVADVVLTGPDGKERTLKGICGYATNNPGVERIHYAVLDPILNLQFDRTDKPGRWQVQATVTDAVQGTYQSATEGFELVP